VTDPIYDAAQALLHVLDIVSADMGHCVACGDYPDHRGEGECEALALRESLGTQTTDEALMESVTTPIKSKGEVVPDMSWCDLGGTNFVLDCPPGTRVQLVRATDQRPRTMGENIRAKHDIAECPWRPPHGCPDCVDPSTGDEGDDSPDCDGSARRLGYDDGEVAGDGQP
jgi:hypothetical protein